MIERINMKKILLLVLIGIMLSGCTEEVMIVRNEETVLTEEEKQERMEKLREEWNNIYSEYSYEWKKSDRFGGAFSFPEWMEMAWRLFNHPLSGEGEAAKYLDDMVDTYGKIKLLMEKTESDVTSINVNEFKNDIEHFKIFVKCVRNDRVVLIECINKKTGKPLINHKKNDPLYEKLKQILNSLSN